MLLQRSVYLTNTKNSHQRICELDNNFSVISRCSFMRNPLPFTEVWQYKVQYSQVSPFVSAAAVLTDVNLHVLSPLFWTSEMLYFRIRRVMVNRTGRAHDADGDIWGTRCGPLIKLLWCTEDDWLEWKHKHLLALVSAEITKNIIFKHHGFYLMLHSMLIQQLHNSVLNSRSGFYTSPFYSTYLLCGDL